MMEGLEKRQILFIHGGMTFRSHAEYIAYLREREVSVVGATKWNGDYLDDGLSDVFEVIRPRMPRFENARYDEWSIHFEKHFPFLRDGVVLAGFSLGATFLLQWLTHNVFPRRIGGIFLVAPAYDNTSGSIESLTGGFVLRGSIDNVSNQCDNVHLYFSRNDTAVVPPTIAKARKRFLEATFHEYEDMGGHFQVAEFPDLIKHILETR